jgi:hypothetical protein
MASLILDTPQKLTQFVTMYNQNPDQAKQWLHGQTMFDGQVDKAWPALVEHMGTARAG